MDVNVNEKIGIAECLRSDTGCCDCGCDYSRMEAD